MRMGNLLIYSAAEIFCIWPRARPRCRRPRASLGRKPIRRGRCASSSVIPLAVVPTLSREQFGRCCSLQSLGSGCQLITITTARLTSSASSKMSKEKQDDDQPEGYDDAGERKSYGVLELKNSASPSVPPPPRLFVGKNTPG